MSREGWHLASCVLGWYRFRRGEPRDYLYRLDVDPRAGKRWEEYLGLFRDAGWEHVVRWGSWHYFRAERGTAFSEEIYTDRESRIAKYRRLLLVVVVCLLMPAAVLWPTWRTLDGRAGVFSFALQVIRIVMLGVGVFAAVRLLALIGRLRKVRTAIDRRRRSALP